MCRNIIPYYSHLSTVSIPYSYRYGFCAKQGEERAVSFAIPRYSGKRQERENTLNASVFSAEYWFYDGRLGRRWNVDPVSNSWESKYAAFANNPVYYNDPNGDDAKKRAEKWAAKNKDKLYKDCPESMEDCPATINTHIGKNGALYADVKLNNAIYGTSIKAFNPNVFEVIAAKRFDKKINKTLTNLSKSIEEGPQAEFNKWMTENLKSIGWGVDLSHSFADMTGAFGANGAVQIQEQLKLYVAGEGDVLDAYVVSNTSVQGELGLKESTNLSTEKSNKEAYLYLFISNKPDQKTKPEIRTENQTSIQVLCFKVVASIGTGSNEKNEYKIGLTSKFGFSFKQSKKGKYGFGFQKHIDALSTYR